MNEENEWDHKISAEVKEGPADCIRMAEVRAVLKKMKKHKDLLHKECPFQRYQIRLVINFVRVQSKSGRLPGDVK